MNREENMVASLIIIVFFKKNLANDNELSIIRPITPYEGKYSISPPTLGAIICLFQEYDDPKMSNFLSIIAIKMTKSLKCQTFSVFLLPHSCPFGVKRTLTLRLGFPCALPHIYS